MKSWELTMIVTWQRLQRLLLIPSAFRYAISHVLLQQLLLFSTDTISITQLHIFLPKITGSQAVFFFSKTVLEADFFLSITNRRFRKIRLVALKGWTAPGIF